MGELRRHIPLLACTAAVLITMVVCTWMIINTIESSLVNIDVNTDTLVEQGRYR